MDRKRWKWKKLKSNKKKMMCLITQIKSENRYNKKEMRGSIYWNGYKLDNYPLW